MNDIIQVRLDGACQFMKKNRRPTSIEANIPINYNSPILGNILKFRTTNALILKKRQKLPKLRWGWMATLSVYMGEDKDKKYIQTTKRGRAV